jgi:hypothetical protein
VIQHGSCALPAESKWKCEMNLYRIHDAKIVDGEPTDGDTTAPPFSTTGPVLQFACDDPYEATNPRASEQATSVHQR